MQHQGHCRRYIVDLHEHPLSSGAGCSAHAHMAAGCAACRLINRAYRFSVLLLLGLAVLTMEQSYRLLLIAMISAAAVWQFSDAAENIPQPTGE